jgi:hypothetical protein
MENPFKTSARTSTARRPDKNSKEFRALYDDPIIIPHDAEPSEQTPLPADDNSWPGILLIGGVIVVLLCLWWLAPEWLGTTVKNIIRQVLHLAGL